MDVISGKIFLDPEKTIQTYEPEEWELDTVLGTAFHKPTRVMFQIGVDEGKEMVSALEIFVRVNHICDCSQMPSGQELISLGRQALVAYLCNVGFLESSDTEKDDMPF